MKLVQILARDIGEWPAGATCVVQNRSSGCYANATNAIDTIVHFEDPGVWFTSLGGWFSVVGEYELADDYQTAVVTREQWEAARKVRAWSLERSELDQVAVIRLDRQVRQNLIALGWLPPEDVQALRDLLNRSTPA